MKPVAWTTMPDADDWEFISGDKDPNNHLDGVWHPLYTADQLREAQVRVLREAADRLAPNGGWRAVELNRMVSELEKADAIRGLA